MKATLFSESLLSYKLPVYKTPCGPN